jgi:phosphopantothenoylcysteine decarboxylase/phosphopantothenate--cysteine ligase
MIVANKVGDNLGFDCDDNSVVVLWRTGEKTFPTTAKSSLAVELIELVSEHYKKSADNTSGLTAIAGND